MHQESEKMGKGLEEAKRSVQRNVEIIMWGLVLVWLGVTAYMTQIGWFPSSYWFAYFAAGLGAILIVDGLVCYVKSIGQHLVRMVCGGFILAVGILGVLSVSVISVWPVFIAAVGAALIAYAIVRVRR